MKGLVKFEPFLPWRRVDSLFQELQNEFFNDFIESPFNSKDRKFSYPKVDIVEEDDKIVIEASVPGLNREDITIEYLEDQLILKANSQNSKEMTNKNYVHKELHKSAFARSFIVPELHFDLSKTEAKLNNGILAVTVYKRDPKKQATKAIEIKVN